jgi:hypothetical protein
MTTRSIAISRFSRRTALAVVAGALMSVSVVSPAIAASSASQGSGLHRQVSAGFGDCKNDNSGAHNGYDCPIPEPESGAVS